MEGRLEIEKRARDINCDPLFSTLAVVELLRIQVELFLDIRQLLQQLLEKEG